VLVERTLLSRTVVWVGAGSDRHMAMVSPLELVRLTQGSTVDIVQE
jgi:prolyl-tRNA editing enzyme YbaK/EbsC (Cys-tRNA(Pro) deacylase)